MKKITLLFFIATLSSLSALAQFNFPTIAGPTNVAQGADVTLNLNDAANTANVTINTYSTFSITVDWADNTNAYSNEAALSVTTTAGTVVATMAGAAGSGAATVLTFTGAFTANYVPATDGFLDIILSQSWAGSSADWSNITVTITPIPSCPDPILAIGNFVAPNFADVSLGAAAGATAYNWEIQPQGVAQGTAGAIDSGMSATIDYTVTNLVTGTDYTLYVQSDCGGALGFYQSLNFTYNFPPVNNECATPTVLTPGIAFATNESVGTLVGSTGSSETAPACAAYAGGDVWYSVIVPADGNIEIETQVDGASTITDTGIEVYSGACGGLASIICNDDNAGGGTFSLASITGRTPGEVLLVRAWVYGGGVEDTFKISAWNATLSIEDLRLSEGFKAYPNPVVDELTISAKNEIKSLSIVNMLGQTVRIVTPNSRNYKLNFADLSSGIYFVKASVNNTEGTIRIVKK
ncbi:MAG: T9SS type A sorting domain-containing protein [Flavobacteriaceae bacterium]|nr:T9SS type A sorting domain-containing protein [Flavobacteriaceae bacterium]